MDAFATLGSTSELTDGEFSRRAMEAVRDEPLPHQGGTLARSSSVGADTDREILEVQRESFDLLREYPGAKSVTMAHPVNGIPCTFHRPIQGNVRFVSPNLLDPESKRDEGKRDEGKRDESKSAGRGVPRNGEHLPYGIQALMGMGTPNARELPPVTRDAAMRNLFSNGIHNYTTYIPYSSQIQNVGSRIRNINWDDTSNNMYQSVGSNQPLTVRFSDGNLPFNPRILRRGRDADADLLQETLFNYQPPNDPIDPIMRARLIENTVSHKPENATACRICLSEYEIGERQLFLPCFHGFHVDCIDRWFETSHRCPECRTEVNC